jgi:hypothetical protein
MKAFLLDIETPPSLPWKQEQIARLEAQHRSPMASGQVEILLRRRERWRIGGAGLFHAAVVRRGDVPPDQDMVEVDAEDGPILFPTGRGPGLRALGPAMTVGLLLFGCTAVSAVAVWRASRPPADPTSAVGVSAPADFPRPANDRLVEDLLAIREAFGGQGLRTIQWRPNEVVVLTEPSTRTAATGRGRAFEKLPVGEGAGLDRWRLARGRAER